MLAGRHAERLFSQLDTVILDEWQADRQQTGHTNGIGPELVADGQSGTADLGDQRHDRQSGCCSQSCPGRWRKASDHHRRGARSLEVASILPDSIDGFPWGGHLGLRRYEDLVGQLVPRISTLLFTNTRNQAERWLQCLRYACRRWKACWRCTTAPWIARNAKRSKQTSKQVICAAVCTSSRDLGVDFQPWARSADRFTQNLARLLQRAGRSAHCLAAPPRCCSCPPMLWNCWSSVLYAEPQCGLVEERHPPLMPLDVLLQHLTTLACGPGFVDQTLNALRQTASFSELQDDQWQWCLQFLEQGGECLGAYERYRNWNEATRLSGGQANSDCSPASPQHRHNHIGPGDPRALVRGSVLGHVEENFVSHLKPKDVFFFAGRQLEFVRCET